MGEGTGPRRRPRCRRGGARVEPQAPDSLASPRPRGSRAGRRPRPPRARARAREGVDVPARAQPVTQSRSARLEEAGDVVGCTRNVPVGAPGGLRRAVVHRRVRGEVPRRTPPRAAREGPGERRLGPVPATSTWDASHCESARERLLPRPAPARRSRAGARSGRRCATAGGCRPGAAGLARHGHRVREALAVPEQHAERHAALEHRAPPPRPPRRRSRRPTRRARRSASSGTRTTRPRGVTASPGGRSPRARRPPAASTRSPRTTP